MLMVAIFFYFSAIPVRSNRYFAPFSRKDSATKSAVSMALPIAFSSTVDFFSIRPLASTRISFRRSLELMKITFETGRCLSFYILIMQEASLEQDGDRIIQLIENNIVRQAQSYKTILLQPFAESEAALRSFENCHKEILTLIEQYEHLAQKTIDELPETMVGQGGAFRLWYKS